MIIVVRLPPPASAPGSFVSPPNTPRATAGTPGRAKGRGDDNVGLAEERTRETGKGLLDEYNAAYQAIGVTLNQRNCIMQFALATAAAGDMLAFVFNRDATNGADTIDAAAYCPGFLVSYTADS